ncbi:MAG: hypothetical protein Q4A30_01970, partial [Candidatus Saccharibacteria bacterium]|nr:hypothetical protein [Candidatus Saccharibacteria bacterium]
MAATQTITYLGGKAELAIGKLVIEPQFLEVINVSFKEGTRTVNSLGGVISTPSGLLESAEVTGTMILPSMDALKIVFPHIYEEKSGSGDGGRVIFGKRECSNQAPVHCNIHYVCEPTSKNDFHINAGLVKMDFDANYNDSDALSVNFTILAQPDSNGEY